MAPVAICMSCKGICRQAGRQLVVQSVSLSENKINNNGFVVALSTATHTRTASGGKSWSLVTSLMAQCRPLGMELAWRLCGCGHWLRRLSSNYWLENRIGLFAWHFSWCIRCWTTAKLHCGNFYCWRSSPSLSPSVPLPLPVSLSVCVWQELYLAALTTACGSLYLGFLYV